MIISFYDVTNRLFISKHPFGVKTASKNGTETRVWGGASSSSRSSKENIFSLISTFWNKNKVRTLAEKCGYLAKQGSGVNIDVENIVNDFKPMIKQGLTKENVLKMSKVCDFQHFFYMLQQKLHEKFHNSNHCCIK